MVVGKGIGGWVQGRSQRVTDPVEAERIFERFYRGGASRTRNGVSGVGLTMAHAIIEAHGGTLTARSGGPATGATFRLRLPRSPHSP